MLLIKKGHITHLLQFPTPSSSPELVCHSLDILCRCPPQQRASPPKNRDISARFSVLKRAAQGLWDDTNTQRAPVPWHSVWRKQCMREWRGGKEENHGTNVCDRKNRSTYSDLVIVALVLHVLIELLLWVKLDPAHLQLLPYLQHKPKPHVTAAFKLLVYPTLWRGWGICSLSNMGILTDTSTVTWELNSQMRWHQPIGSGKGLTNYHHRKLIYSCCWEQHYHSFVICVSDHLMNVTFTLFLALFWSPPFPEGDIWLCVCCLVLCRGFLEPFHWNVYLLTEHMGQENNQLKHAKMLHRDEWKCGVRCWFSISGASDITHMLQQSFDPFLMLKY